MSLKSGRNPVPGPISLTFRVPVWYLLLWRDGRVDYCGCLENSWVNRPGGSNPSPSARAMAPRTCTIIVNCIALFVVVSCAAICHRRGREERNIYMRQEPFLDGGE